MRFELRFLLFALIVLATMVVFPRSVSAEPPAKEASAKETSQKKPWEFDESLYTNSPKTGERTWQYHKAKNAYRDPNAWFDSPHMAYPFNGNWTIQPYDVFPYPYNSGPNAEHPSYAPDPYWPEAQEE